MTSGFTENWETQVRKGLLELYALTSLLERERYGYEISKVLATIDGLVIGDGSIYPVLSRLKREGLIRAKLVESPNGPARKYYGLTRGGRTQLKIMSERWDELTSGIDRLREAGQ